MDDLERLINDAAFGLASPRSAPSTTEFCCHAPALIRDLKAQKAEIISLQCQLMTSEPLYARRKLMRENDAMRAMLKNLTNLAKPRNMAEAVCILNYVREHSEAALKRVGA